MIARNLTFRRIILQKPPVLVWMCVGVLMIMTIALILSLFMIKIDHVMMADAQVEIFEESKVKSAFQNAVVDAIFVEQGQVVAAGTPILRLRDAELEGQITLLRADINRLKAEVIRLNAQLSGSEPVYTADFILENQAIVQSQNTQYELFNEAKKARNLRSIEKAGQALARWERLNKIVLGLEADFASAKDSTTKISRPADIGYSPAEWLRFDRAEQLTKLREYLVNMRSKENEALAALSEARLNAGLDAQAFESDILSQRDEKQNALSARLKLLQEIEGYQDNLILRAEETTLIHDIYVEAPGQQVSTGDPLVMLVPQNKIYRATAYVDAYTVNTLDSGKLIQLRFRDAYHKTAQSTDGIIETISPKPVFEDASGTPYYQITAKTSPAALLTPLHKAEVVIRESRKPLIGVIYQFLSHAESLNKKNIEQFSIEKI